MKQINHTDTEGVVCPHCSSSGPHRGSSLVSFETCVQCGGPFTYTKKDVRTYTTKKHIEPESIDAEKLQAIRREMKESGERIDAMLLGLGIGDD